MITQSKSLRFGHWVYLPKAIDSYPVGTFGKVEFFPALLHVQVKTPLGQVFRVHQDTLEKLSIEEIQFGESDVYMLIEPLGDFPAGTTVHFIRGLGGDTPTCFTDEGLEVFAVPRDKLMRVVEEDENAVVWFIQQCLIKKLR